MEENGVCRNLGSYGTLMVFWEKIFTELLSSNIPRFKTVLQMSHSYHFV